MHIALRQAGAVFKKNLKRSLDNKKKLLSQFIFPVVVSIVYYFYKTHQSQPGPLSIILGFMVTIYVGLINSSMLKQTITLFVCEREEGSRQYQYVMGMSKKVHTLSNMLYVMVYTSVFLFPFYVVVNLFGFNYLYVYNFACFVVSSNFLAIALTSFFNQHKVATEVIGVLFSLGAFLPFVYNAEMSNFKSYLAIIVPNSSFTLALLAKDQYDRFKISLASVLMWKFYLLIFYVVEFRQDSLETIKSLLGKCKRCLKMGRQDKSSEILMQQSQGEASSVLAWSQVQGDDIRNMAPTLELRNVVKKFGNFTAVNSVSLKLHKSQILGLLGRNGAGKTTIVDMITKVTHPTAGSIALSESKQKPIKVGICYQHQILYEDLTVIDHLKFYSAIKGVDKPDQQIDRIAKQVGIQNQFGKRIKQLSGGTKRKVSFCIALLDDPNLLIFDEPTSGLDPASRRQIWRIMEQRRSAQTSIILTTHHLDEADHLSNRICVIRKGRIVEEGTPEKIKQVHGNGYYLTINHDAESGLPFDVKLCNKIVKELLPEAKLKDKGLKNLKYFIEKAENVQKLCQCISSLEQLSSICISLQANSLQQSFIAIDAMDADEIETSLQIMSQSVNIQQAEEGRRASNLHQIAGILLKNFYCFIYKFHWFYNMNIIILIFVKAINSLIVDKITQLDPNLPSQSATQQQASNPLFIIQGYIIMSSAFLSIPVLEKEEKIIQLLRTRGVRRLNYWLGHFLFDFAYFILNYAVMLILFKQSVSGLPTWVLLGTACSIIVYSYLCSMIFSKIKTANTWFTAINSLLSLVMMPLMVPDALIQGSFYAYLRPLKYLSPYFDISAFMVRQQSTLMAATGGFQTEQAFNIHYTLIGYVVVFVLLEGSFVQRIFKKQQDQMCIADIKLQNVGKKYKEVEALVDVNYEVHNEKLALLGHNGAGKSTTFGLISAQLNPSQGKVFLQRHLKMQYNDILKSVGICYQDDTLWKFMTPSNILKIFSLLTPSNSNQILFLQENLDVQRIYMDRKFQHLSGGNKRKICMAVCLLGSPRVKLLDECSTGLDPVSRLSMVNTLKIQHEGSTVLTTHSFAEAEQVCERAIIMEKGKVKEDNKVFKLKEKYYNCYWVTLMLKGNDGLQQIAESILGGVCQFTIITKNNKKMIEISKQQIKLSVLLQLLMKHSKSTIANFKIYEPKLEDVYLLLTAEQQDRQQLQEVQLY